MDRWFNWMEREGLFISHTVLLFAPLIIGISIGIWAGKRWQTWIGWLVGILVAFVGYSMFVPVIELIEERGCEINPDYEDCYS